MGALQISSAARKFLSLPNILAALPKYLAAAQIVVSASENVYTTIIMSIGGKTSNSIFDRTNWPI